MTPEERTAEAFDKFTGSRVADPIIFADAMRAAIAEEREACAKLAESECSGLTAYGPVLAAAIRARKT